MSPTGLQPDGYHAPTHAEEVADLNAKIHANVDPGLNLDPSTPLGQIVDLFASKFDLINELGAAIYNALDPANASGNLLVNACALSGTRPQVATYSTVVATLTLNASTTVHAGAVAAVNGDPTNTWILEADAVNDALSTQPVNALFRASRPGPIDAFSGMLTQILTPTIGLTAINNPGDAIRGLAADDDPSLRAKRVKELSGEGTSNVDAIRARLLEIEHMVAVTIYANTTPIGPDANGVPSKAIRICYYDGPGALADTALIAQTIFDQKPAGIQAFGNLTFEAHDSTGAEHDVQLDRAEEKPVYVSATVTAAPGVSIGAPERATIKAAIAKYAASAFTLGTSIIALPFRASAIVPGVSVDCSSLAFDFNPSPVNTANLAITGLQIATVSTTNVLVNGL